MAESFCCATQVWLSWTGTKYLPRLTWLGWQGTGCLPSGSHCPRRISLTWLSSDQKHVGWVQTATQELAARQRWVWGEFHCLFQKYSPWVWSSFSPAEQRGGRKHDGPECSLQTRQLSGILAGTLEIKTQHIAQKNGLQATCHGSN